MAQHLDFFFFYGSTYTYLTVMRIEKLTEAAGVTVRWRPINLRQIMIEMDNIPFAKKPVKARYMWRDLERRARKHGIPFVQQPVYPVEPDLLASRVGVVAAEQGWCPEYTKETYRAWFLENKGAGMGNNVEEALSALGKDPHEIIGLANSDRIKERLQAETDAAKALGVFGSPTFAVGDEIFWGDDRLEEALDWCRSAQPQAA